MDGKFEKVLEQVGFQVIHVIGNKSQDECFVVNPTDKEEQTKFGAAVFSVRAMQALGELFDESRRFSRS